MTAAPSATEQSKRKKPAPSGRLLLRMPAALHAELARTAERDGVSLNQFITQALAGKIGWGTDADDQSAPPVAPADGRARLIAVALVVNAVVIGLAALAAIAVLVLAWRG
jgi:hypothetical protein